MSISMNGFALGAQKSSGSQTSGMTDAELKRMKEVEDRVDTLDKDLVVLDTQVNQP